jgi:hypothetical protein
VPRIGEKLQLVAVKSVAVIGEQMDENNCGSYAEQPCCVGPAIRAEWLLFSVV